MTTQGGSGLGTTDPAAIDPGDGGDILDRAEAGGALIRGGILRAGGYAATVGLSVLSASLLTRHLSVAQFGRYTTVISLVALVAVVTDSGMSNIGTREYATLKEPRRGEMMRSLLGLRVALTLIGVALTMVWSLVVGYDSTLLLGALVASLATVVLVAQHTLTIPLTTELRLGTLSALDFGRQALQVLGIVVLVLLGAGLLPLLAVTLPAYLIILIPTALIARHRISLRPSLRIGEWPPLLRATVAFSLATAVGTMYVYAAQLITSLVASPFQSGVFATSFRVFIVAAGIPGPVIGSALPVLSRAARDDHTRLAYVLQRIFDASLIAGVGFALALSAGAGFVISVIGGHKYASAAPVLQLQAFAMIASFLLAGWSYGLISLHRHRALVFTNLSALVVSVGLTVTLAHSDGAQGAAIATLAGEATLAVTSLVALARGRPEYAPRLGITAKIVGAGGAAAAAAFIPPMPSLVRAVVALAVYAALILATGALPQEFREMLPRRRVKD